MSLEARPPAMAGRAFQVNLLTPSDGTLAIPVDAGEAAVLKQTVSSLDQFGEAGDGFQSARRWFATLRATRLMEAKHERNS